MNTEQFSHSAGSLHQDKNLSNRNELVVKIVIMLVHRLHNHVMNQQLHFHVAVMHNKALNRVVHDQHHWQTQYTDNFKHPGIECISTMTNPLDEWFLQHHGSDQPVQLESAEQQVAALHSTCGGLEREMM